MSVSTAQQGRHGWLVSLTPWLFVGGLVLFHAANNWVWLVENVTSTGWDKPRHLARSLQYTDMVSPPTIKSLFAIMVSDPVRPPFFPASAAITYALFGRSADVATMVNVIYLAIVLAATYGLGQRWGGRWQGLASALLLACFPMFYAMSRYFYLEFALTAMVTLTAYLLLASEGFKRPWVSLLCGISLGLGLLTKRTFSIFAAGPVIVVVLTSGLVPMAWRRLKQRPRLHWRNVLLALFGGLALAGLWYLPNRETARSLILGDALFVIWWLLAGLTIYFLTLPSAPLANALASFFLAAGMASTWYLARIEFLERVALYGYGIDDPRGRALQLDHLDTYLYYLRKLGNEHLSLALAVVLGLVLLVAVVIYLRRQASVQEAVRSVRTECWLALSWLGGAYTLLTLSIYQETRAFTAALPAVALLFAAALFTLPWRRVRWSLLALVVVYSLLQFLVVSYEPVNQLLPPRWFNLPGWGRTSIFAQGVYIQLPDEDGTDRGYWIQPDVLSRMEASRQSLGQSSASLGLLVNTSQINAGPFNYLILTDYPRLRVESLIDRFDETSPYSRLFAHDYVAIKAVNAGINPAQKEVIDTLLEDPPEIFAQAFELEAAYPLPDGDTVYLYRQRYSLPADYPVEFVTRLARSLVDQTRPGDAVILTPWELASAFAADYAGPAEIYLAPHTEAELADIAAGHPRVYLVLGDAEAGASHELAQAWLDQNAFRASHEWADSHQVLTYGTAAGALPLAPTTTTQASLGDEIELTGYALHNRSWQPGDIIPVTLFWTRGQSAPEHDYHVFVHLLDETGQPVAQADSAPVGGRRPTSGWEKDEQIVDRHGLLVPASLPAGTYTLQVGMYLLETGERLRVVRSDGESTDGAVTLAELTVAPP